MSDEQIGNGSMHDFQADKIRKLEAALASCERQRKAAVEALVKCHKALELWDGSQVSSGHFLQLLEAKASISNALAAQPSTTEI